MKAEPTLEKPPKALAARSRVAVRATAQMEMTFVDPRSDSQWDQEVGLHPSSTAFHSAGWAKVLSKSYGHVPFYLRIHKDGETAAIVPMMEVRSVLTGCRGVCLPFSDSCGPLIFEQAGEEAFLNSLAALARERKWKYFEVRGPITPVKGAKPAVEFLAHTLSLSGGLESLFSGLAGPVRRAIRKAEKCGVTVRISQDPTAVEEFYRIHALTRRRHGLPPQPLKFFRNVQDEMIDAGMGFTALAWKASRPVAGAVFLHLGKKALYKFGASMDEGQEARANNSVMWEAIKSLTQRGCETLEFGRTSRENCGLRRFKLGWGTREQTLGYFRFDPTSGRCLTGKDKATGLHNVVFRKLPLLFNRIAGSMIYPHLD